MDSDFQAIPLIVVCFDAWISLFIQASVARHVLASLIPVILPLLLRRLMIQILVNDKDLQEVVQMLEDACKDIGFFYVKGHGICELLMKEVRDVAQKFFQLPYEETMKIKMTRQNGYRISKTRRVYYHGKPDMHEAINYLTPIVPGKYGNLGKAFEGSNLWPEYPSNSKLLLENYINLLKDLSRKIMRGIALALGGPVDAFEGTIAGDPYWGIRLVSYPGWLIDIPEEKCANTGMGSHTDYGLLTLVNQDDDICALEVQNQSGEWIHARPIPGTFVCNIGDMLEVYSNGIYHPTVHRVVNNSPCCRVSAVFFYETNFDTAIEPVGFCKEKTGGVAKYEKVVYGEHLFRMACDCYDDV